MDDLTYPATDASHKRECPGSLLKSGCKGSAAIGKLQECASEEAEGGDQGEEDHEENEVGAEGAYEVDQAEQSHADHKVRCV